MTSSLRKLLSCWKFLFVLLVLVVGGGTAAYALSPTVTTLTVSAAGASVTSVAALTAVTLTATVTFGGAPVTQGQVNFCDATATYCTDIHLLGSASLTTAGTASWKFVPGLGTHSYKAVFQPTTQYGSSASAASSLTVSGQLHSITALDWTGQRGSYSLNATLSGSGEYSPSGLVTFEDTTEKRSLGSSELYKLTGSVFSFDPVGTATGLGSALVDVNGDGVLDLITTYSYTYANGGTCLAPVGAGETTDRAAVYIGNGDGSFTHASGKDLTVPCNSTSIGVGDFNGDGHADLVISSHSNGGTVFLGDGTGNFTSGASAGGGNVLVLDVNGDGILDIIGMAPSFSVYLGDGAGNFTPKAQPATYYPLNGTAADFNGDGVPDLAVVSVAQGASMTAPMIQILNGVGDGTFVLSSAAPTLDTTPQVIYSSDLNSDGKADLVVLSISPNAGYTDPMIYTLIGDGAGEFTIGDFYVIPAPQPGGGTNLTGFPYGIAIGDFNGDGIPDVAGAPVGHFDDSFPVEILLGDGTGKLSAKTVKLAGVTSGATLPYPDVYSPVLSVGDVNGDGMADLLTAGGGYLIADHGVTAMVGPTSVPPVSTGYHNITANFTNDVSTYLPSVSAPVSLLSPQGPLSFTLTASANPAAPQSPLTLSATITGKGAAPTASVAFEANGGIVGYAKFVNGVASYTVTTPGPGSVSYQAFYDGDLNYSSSESSPLIVTISNPNAPTPTIKLTTTATSIPYGASVTFTTTLSGTNGTPTGTVVIQVDGASVAIVPVANGVASYTPKGQQLAVGAHRVVAVYAGDSNYGAATSSAVNMTVSQGTATIALTSSVPSSPYTSPITFTAQLTYGGVAPTGQITLYDGGTAITSLTPVNGVISYADSGLSVGQHSITAKYAGDGNYAAVTSSAAPVTVVKIAASINDYEFLTGSFIYGKPATLVATVSGGVHGVYPTGTVTFNYGSTVLGTANVMANTQAALTVPPGGLPAGPDVITMAYSGDPYFTAASGSGTALVGQAQIPMWVTASSTTAISGAPITFTFHTEYGGAPPTGKVTLYDGPYNDAAAVGTLTLTNGGGTDTLSNLSVGTHSIYANYSGDANYVNGITTAIAITITQAQTVTITPTPTNSTSYVGSSNMVKIVLTGVSGKATPTGTITLAGSGYSSSATTLVNGSASITIPANTLPTGNDTLTAAYSGDSVYAPSSSSFQITVTDTPPSFSVTGKSSSISLSPGATTGNTVPITITPSEGFTGTVTLAAALTASPAGALDLPTFSFGATNPVALAGTGAGTATLTITTTAPSTSAAVHRSAGLPLYVAGGTAFACLALLGVPGRARRLRMLLSLLFCLGLYASLTACGGSSSSSGGSGPKGTPGTTAGSYTIQITATSGAATSNTSITLTVE